MGKASHRLIESRELVAGSQPPSASGG